MTVWRGVALTLGAAGLGGCLLRPAVTGTFGFRPTPMRDGKATPAAWGWTAARLDSVARADSTHFLVWIATPPDGVRRCGAALLLHGKGRNRAEMLPLGRVLQERGFSVLIPDYRGYGGSSGRPSTDGVQEDARLAYGALRKMVRDSALPMIVVGHSMGTALAARVAREQRPTAAVYMAPFARIGSLVRGRFGVLGPRLFDTTVFAFNPADDARLTQGRQLVVVAGRDAVIPVKESDAFIAALGSPAVVRDPLATHDGILESPLALQAVGDSAGAWAGCSVAGGAGDGR